MQVKDSNRVSGHGRIECPFYEEIDAILGTRAASTPPNLLESSMSASGTQGLSGEEHVYKRLSTQLRIV